MSKKRKELLIGIAVVLMVSVAVVWMLVDGIDHIEDTNGADDFSLQTITDENIIRMDTGSRGSGIKTDFSGDIGGIHISSGIESSSKKFTGVEEILYDNFILPSDFEVNLTSFTVRGGNFKMVVVHDDKIIAELKPGEDVYYRLDNVKGTVSLRIAGESASYSFYMNETDYDFHDHP
jgi:hypothetical protein